MITTGKKELANRHNGFHIIKLASFLVLFIVFFFIAAGCGVQTEEANRALSKANEHKAKAEEILGRIKSFPAEWEAIFNVPRIGAEQLSRARGIVDAKEQEIALIDSELKSWGTDLHSILSLNVDEKIKEYVRLQMNVIDCYADYLKSYLRPIIKSYVGIVELLEAGRPITQLNTQAEDIRNMVNDSLSKLEECKEAEKKAEEYFKANKLGK